MNFNFKSLKQELLEEWNDVRGGWNDITQDAKEEFDDIAGDLNDIKEEWVQEWWRQLDEHTNSEKIGMGQKKRLIRMYEKEIQEPGLSLTLNKTISNLLPSAKALAEYYENRPEMTEYTMTKELERINYTIYTHDNRKLTDPSEILSYQKECGVMKDGILWRCSNQSLLADVVAALTSETGLIRPQMQAAMSIDDFSLTLNFSDNMPNVYAECYLNVSVPGSSDNERVPLTGALVTVWFCPGREEFRANVSCIFPCPRLTERDVDNAARSLLE